MNPVCHGMFMEFFDGNRWFGGVWVPTHYFCRKCGKRLPVKEAES
jgi:hypothetical protein